MNKIVWIFTIISVLCLAANSLSASENDTKEEELLFVAQKAFEDGFYDVALNYLSEFLEDYPQTDKRSDVYLLMGKCHLYQTQYLKALDVLEKLLDMPETKDIQDAALFWLGEVHFKGKEYDLAEVRYRKIISDFPDSEYLSFAYYSLGWSLFEQDKFQESLEYFKELINNFPEHELIDESTFKAAVCLFNLRELDRSEEYFNLYIKEYSQEELIDQVYFYLGELRYYQDEFDAAIISYEKSIDILEDSQTSFLSKTGIAWSYLKLEKYDEARSAFQDAIELAEDNNFSMDAILLGQANLETEQGNHEQAMDIYQKIIDSSSESEVLPEAYLGKANALYALGRESQTIPLYEALLEQFKDSVSRDLTDKAYFGLAWTYLKLDKLKDAIKYLELIAEETNDKTAKVSALCQIGDAYQDAGKLEEALRAYDKVLKDYPESFYSDYVQCQEGIIFLQLERIDAATIAFQSLRKNFPDSKYIADSQYYLGLTYFKKEDFAAARVQLEDFLGNATENTDIEYKKQANFLLGMALYNLEMYRDAANVYRMIIKNFSDDETLIQKSEYEIAHCFYELGKVADALKKFKIIIYKFPNSSVGLDTLSWLGSYYIKVADFDMARKYFKKIVDEFPEHKMDARAHYQIARSYQLENRFKEALDEFKEVRKVSNSKLAGLASLDIAQILSQTQGNKDAVVKEYEHILTQYPNLAKKTYVGLAQFYSSIGDYTNAIESLEKSLDAPLDDSDVQDSQTQFSLAGLFEEKGALDKAIETYLKITYLYPEGKLAIKSHLRIARIFENKKEWQKAKKTYEKIVQAQIEESKFAQERLDLIEQNTRN